MGERICEGGEIKRVYFARERETDRQTDRQRETQTDRQAQRERHRWTDRERECWMTDQ